LNKDHLYRIHHANYSFNARAIVNDNYGSASTEIWGQNGWKLSPIVGKDNVTAGTYANATEGNSYLFGYVCGSGTYTSLAGVSSTSFIESDYEVAFNGYFGAYFGDWDNPDNFLRAPLASRYGLTR
jgi:hypothetical protein